MDFDIITLFPRMFEGLLSESIVRIAVEKQLARIRIVDLRAYAHDRRRTVDDKPYGGGPGMVLKPEPIVEAVEDCLRRVSARATGARIVLFAAQGKRLTQDVVRDLASADRLILLSGRYEGV